MTDQVATRRVVLLHALCFTITRRRLRHAPPLGAIRTVDTRNGLKQPLPFLGRHPVEHGSIGCDRLEKFDCVAEAFPLSC